MKKVLGILGGMGPYASLEFARKILDLTPAVKEWDHIRTVHDSNIDIPSRTRAILYGEASPAPGMIEGINRLADYGADVVVVPCNSAHYFYPEVRDHIRIPWLNMLECVSDEVHSAGVSRPIVLGGYVTITKRTYSPYLNCVYLEAEQNDLVYALIEAVKTNDAGRSEALATQIAGAVTQALDQGVADSVILGCTELTMPQALHQIGTAPSFDTSLIYARRTVKDCLG